MDGDDIASAGRTSASVTDSLGDSVTDSDWLAGQVLETDTYTGTGGSVDQKTINGPWTYKTDGEQAQPGSLPTLTAELPQAARPGRWRCWPTGPGAPLRPTPPTTPTAWSTRSTPRATAAHRTRRSARRSAYATSSAKPMMVAYPSEVIEVAGPCGTTPTAGQHRVGHPDVLRRGRQRIADQHGDAREASPGAGRSPAPRSSPGTAPPAARSSRPSPPPPTTSTAGRWNRRTPMTTSPVPPTARPPGRCPRRPWRPTRWAGAPRPHWTPHGNCR